MNITKQQWTIIGVIIVLIAIWYFFLRKKPAKAESNYRRTIATTTETVPKCSHTSTGGWVSIPCEKTDGTIQM